MRIFHRQSRTLRGALLGSIVTAAGAWSATAAAATDVAHGGDTARCCRVVELW